MNTKNIDNNLIIRNNNIKSLKIYFKFKIYIVFFIWINDIIFNNWIIFVSKY